ncbi:LCP family protein [Streptomyces sp. NBC_01795]|uniref:LCP family protein n=2 Tax=unclassified Streptomyces TaxID=2593676 RepID=UPI002DD7A32D|nr:LCP family protein [Streptomyces sp. NBC_01795]WSA94350.1 LCP family protein [Streptomyces sp. NBC_01795]WSS41812.1 LCP family protein [Streptomyces sp. NBC_01187]
MPERGQSPGPPGPAAAAPRSRTGGGGGPGGDPGAGPGGRGREKGRPRWGRRITIATSLLLLTASGVGHAMVKELNSDVRRVDPFHGLTDRPRDTDGSNVLVVGTDRRDKISTEQKKKYKLGGAACECTDTLMLVHLSADRKRASVVSLPRDSYTELPAHQDRATGKVLPARPAKLNAAYTAGGPALTVRTVEKMTNVHVDHYLEVDFTSFMSTVDVLGGVPVCTEKPLKDSYSGLSLPKGTTRLDGGQALQYVRARHLDGGSDLGRMKRQQRFLASVISRATDNGVLMNPVRFNQVARTLLRSVRADHGFGSGQMMALGQAMRGFRPSSSEFASVPLSETDFRAPKLGSTVRWDQKKAEELFTALRSDRPLSVDKQPARRSGPAQVEVPPRNIRVEVRNATGKTGLGARVDRELRASGFATTRTPANAPRAQDSRTTLTYDPHWDRSARSLAAALPGVEMVAAKGQGPRMKVTVGAPDQRVRRVRAPALASAPGGAPVRGDRVGCG